MKLVKVILIVTERVVPAAASTFSVCPALHKATTEWGEKNPVAYVTKKPGEMYKNEHIHVNLWLEVKVVLMSEQMM